MKRLENLPQIAAHQLGGLEATSKILAKAKLQAAEARAPRSRMASLRPVLAVCTALVLCVGAALWATGGTDAPLMAPDAGLPNVLDSRSAGDQATPTEAPLTAQDVPTGSISMSAGGARGEKTLFAQGKDGSYPILSIDGAAYRLLQVPANVAPSLLGDALGVVSEFNKEPALGTGGVVSNVVGRGQTVRAVDGMSGALVAAEVDGQQRLFQRVSYAGTAVIGSETLADTLCQPGQVEWLELSGYGRVTDAAAAQELVALLLDTAEYQGTGMSGSGSLMIGLQNGLTLQLLVADESVSACGTWSSPDFFEAYAMAEVK